MKLGFFYGGTVIKDAEGSYYSVAYTDKFFGRYLAWAESVECCMCVSQSDNVEGLTKIKVENVKFTKCVNFFTLNGMMSANKAKEIILEVLERCDVAVVRLPSKIGEIAAECCKKLNKKYLVEVVGCPWDSLWNHSIRGKLLAIPYSISTKKIVKDAPAVLYVTDVFLQSRYPTEGISIGCSDVELCPMEKDILEKRLDKIGRHRGKVIIGTIGAVNVKYKGQQFVIEALGRLKQKGITRFEYQLVGRGEQEYLKLMAKKYGVEEQVSFLGGLPHEKVFDWLDSIDIYVQPSRTEGLPRALVEAMSRGLPAFGAKSGGIPELLNEKFIFSNTGRNINEIILILERYDMQVMREQAKENFSKSNEYRSEKLEKKRYDFYVKYFLKE